MKTVWFRSVALVCLIVLFSGTVFGRPVSSSEAVCAARSKLAARGMLQERMLNDASPVLADGRVYAYLFPLFPKGYVVVSADTQLPPVVAYSFYADTLPANKHAHPLFRVVCADLALRLKHAGEFPEVARTNESNWRHIIAVNGFVQAPVVFQQWPEPGTTPTEGWVETQWSQNAPYNNMCPIDSETSQRSVAGCPAIAMAQIMAYHQTSNDTRFSDADDYYHSYGSRQYWIDNDHDTYDFPSFPELNGYFDTLDSHFDSQQALTDQDKAALCFACGVAAEQVYSSGVSGTFGIDQAFDAFTRFGCTAISLLQEDVPTTYEHMAQNIKQALPVHLGLIVSGGPGGHNVVVDGYNTDAYFHVNFGWGGPYDGWYLLPDGMPYNLTILEGAIVDIMHPGGEIVPMYRFFNTERGGHVYTISQVERDYIINNLPQYNYEGIKFRVYKGPAQGATAVYRFFNTNTQIHLYTISTAERDYILANLPHYNYEGIKFYVHAQAETDTVPVYRFFHNVHGGHLYTISQVERDVLLNMPQYNFEGIKFYVFLPE